MSTKCDHCGYERREDPKDAGPRCIVCGVDYEISARLKANNPNWPPSGGRRDNSTDDTRWDGVDQTLRSIMEWINIGFHMFVTGAQLVFLAMAVGIFPDSITGSVFFVAAALYLGTYKDGNNKR